MVPCIAVFDIGKTNKKFLLFDRDYQIVKDEEVCLKEIEDEDGDKCEDIQALTHWLKTTWKAIEADLSYDVQAVNFTCYGASLVHLDEAGALVTPLYNYLKAFPEDLEKQFYDTYGSKLEVATQTASPPLGMLNSGLQLYWLKHKKPALFKKIKHTLHFPQYISYLFTGQMASEFTSIGCHTALWDFEKKEYHAWVQAEGIDTLFPPLREHTKPYKAVFRGNQIPAGLGLHDSSAALVPYLKQYREPFLLLSTGTWGITLNPFAKQPIGATELQKDCLLSMAYTGNKVKASRKFIGNAHEEHVKALALHYEKPLDYYKTVSYNAALLQEDDGFTVSNTPTQEQVRVEDKLITAVTIELDFALYPSYEAAYHQLIRQLVQQQVASIFLVIEEGLSDFRIMLVDGGFSKNPIFMELLRKNFPELKIKAGKSAQGTALGAALVMEL